jgi:hypothetical protein
MPVEIRELIIRAEVAPQQGGGGASGTGDTAVSDREQLIRDCVEQVMELIRQKEER